jgi:hypothetical protein
MSTRASAKAGVASNPVSLYGRRVSLRRAGAVSAPDAHRVRALLEFPIARSDASRLVGAAWGRARQTTEHGAILAGGQMSNPIAALVALADMDIERVLEEHGNDPVLCALPRDLLRELYLQHIVKHLQDIRDTMLQKPGEAE